MNLKDIKEAKPEEVIQQVAVTDVKNRNSSQETKPAFKALEGTLRSVEDTSELLKYLEPEIVEFADRLSAKLFFLRFDILMDLNQFVDNLEVSPGDKIILAGSMNDSLLLSNLSAAFQSKGAVVYSFYSQKLPQGTFALGVSRKVNA